MFSMPHGVGRDQHKISRPHLAHLVVDAHAPLPAHDDADLLGRVTMRRLPAA